MAHQDRVEELLHLGAEPLLGPSARLSAPESARPYWQVWAHQECVEELLRLGANPLQRTLLSNQTALDRMLMSRFVPDTPTSKCVLPPPLFSSFRSSSSRLIMSDSPLHGDFQCLTFHLTRCSQALPQFDPGAFPT